MSDRQGCRHKTLELINNSLIRCISCRKTWVFKNQTSNIKTFEHSLRAGGV